MMCLSAGSHLHSQKDLINITQRSDLRLIMEHDSQRNLHAINQMSSQLSQHMAGVIKGWLMNFGN